MTPFAAMDFWLLVPIVGQFVLRPMKTLLATTKEELDAALATADQITVEGDDELLSYAVNKTAGDPTNRVTVEATDDGAEEDVIVESDDDDADAGPTDDPFPTRRARRSRTPKPASPRLNPLSIQLSRARFGVLPSRGSLAGALAVAGLVALLVAPVAWWLWLSFRNEPGFTQSSTASPQPPLPQSKSDFWTNLPSLLWPAVAIVAILALFLIARQAISSGSNVTIVWKVTEKVSGRVVITKVGERPTRSPEAA